MLKNSLTMRQAELVVAVLSDVLGTGATLDRAYEYADQAKAALSILPDSDWRKALEAVADYAVSRGA